MGAGSGLDGPDMGAGEGPCCAPAHSDEKWVSVLSCLMWRGTCFLGKVKVSLVGKVLVCGIVVVVCYWFFSFCGTRVLGGGYIVEFEVYMSFREDKETVQAKFAEGRRE